MPSFSCYPLKVTIDIDSTSVAEIREIIALHMNWNTKSVVIYNGSRVLCNSDSVELDDQLHGGVLPAKCYDVHS